ncbi:O-methyltransferase [Gallaecimonas sp. GXIMD1310]|uniref:O-methyltransferase n=1 Tax=Gallaecimonas sp. GXIMD1310 TaxID=3131926 RepID=UPI003250B951
MSATNIPYHLRTNKAIDRQIFFEILNRLSLRNKVQTYKYVSLGGPMLEDHHILHHSLGITNLESVERDKAVYSRQEFNRVYNCIKCLNTSIGEYINNFERQGSTIVWLDYTNTQWNTQLIEFSDLLNKLDEFDICKITINANPDSLVDFSDKELDRLEVFRKRASGKFFNENVLINDVTTMDRFALTLSEMIHTAVQSTLDLTEELSFFPITIFRYIDNRCQMLSVTGIVLKKNDGEGISNLIKDSHLDVTSHICSSWNDVHEINVPDLTLREKFEINKMLPIKDGMVDVDQLPFKLNNNGIRARKEIESYMKYYRYIPNFQKLSM